MKIPVQALATKGTQQSLITIAGNIISAFFAAVSIILISRKMGPELFGEFSAGFSFVLILNKINDLGISLATHKLIGETTDKNKIITFSNSVLKIKLLISLTLIILLLPLSKIITNVLSFSNVYTAPVSIVIGTSIVYYEYLISVLQAVHSFLSAVLANFSQSFLKWILSLLFFFGILTNPTHVFALYVFVPIIPFLLYKVFAPKWLTINLTLATKTSERTIIHLAKFTAMAILSLTVMENAGVLFVKAYLTDFEAGVLGGISRIALLFSLIGVSLSQVLNPRVSRYKIKSDIDIYIKKALLVFAGSVLAYIFLLPFNKLIIHSILGSQYVSGESSLAILLASVFISIATVPFAALFFSFDRNKYFVVTGVTQLVLTIVGNYFFVPEFGLTGSVGTQLFTRLVVFLFTLGLAYDTYKRVYDT